MTSWTPESIPNTSSPMEEYNRKCPICKRKMAVYFSGGFIKSYSCKPCGLGVNRESTFVYMSPGCTEEMRSKVKEFLAIANGMPEFLPVDHPYREEYDECTEVRHSIDITGDTNQ